MKEKRDMSRMALMAVIALMMFASCDVPADSSSDADYQTYTTAGDLGTQLFTQDIASSGPIYRTWAILGVCGDDGLANAVLSKIKDPQFTQGVYGLIKAKKFDKLQHWAFLLTQSTANGLSVGYRFGYKDAVSALLEDPAYKQTVCTEAVKSANDILR